VTNPWHNLLLSHKGDATNYGCKIGYVPLSRLGYISLSVMEDNFQ
jgi:hypothetical protein